MNKSISIPAKSVVALIVSLVANLLLCAGVVFFSPDLNSFAVSFLPDELVNLENFPGLSGNGDDELTNENYEEVMNQKATAIARKIKMTGEETPAEDFTYDIYGDNNIRITSYTGVDTRVVIPAMIDKMPVTAIGSHCFENNIYLSEVVLPDTIVYIDEYAFAYCEKLSSVELPAYLFRIAESGFNGDLSLTKVTARADMNGKSYGVRQVGSSAFENCAALSEASGVEAAVELGDSCFMNCGALSSFQLSGDVTYIGSSTFQNCSSLSEVSFGERTVTKTEDGEFITTGIGSNCFENTAVSEINLPGYVRTIGEYNFVNCANLTSFTWENSGQNQPTQEYGDCLFENCPSLTDVYLPITVCNSARFTEDEMQHFAIHTSSRSIREYCDEVQLNYDDWN